MAQLQQEMAGCCQHLNPTADVHWPSTDALQKDLCGSGEVDQWIQALFTQMTWVWIPPHTHLPTHRGYDPLTPESQRWRVGLEDPKGLLVISLDKTQKTLGSLRNPFSREQDGE